MPETPKEIVAVTDHYIEVCVGHAEWVVPDGRFIVEKDYAVQGEIWRVHKNDPDPFPSRPHAHCIAGKKRFVGCKLHLGTAELYRGPDPVGRRLAPKQFARLIELIQPKFPDIAFPLPVK